MKKGFDGHLFLVGLLDHLRNLMVCKDKATAQLIEVSASTQQKYLDQAEQVSLSFLLSALSIGSLCDINYKSAKNQRLHVEICLLKIANISNLFQLASLPHTEVEKKNNEPNPNNSIAPTGRLHHKLILKFLLKISLLKRIWL